MVISNGGKLIMSEKIGRDLWIFSYTYGHNRWARSDGCHEIDCLIITDLHPVEYIPRVLEFWDGDGAGTVTNFKTVMEIKKNTITATQLNR